MMLQVAGKEAFGLSALGPGGTLIQLVSQGDDRTHLLTDSSGPNIARTAAVDSATALDQLPATGSAVAVANNAGGPRLTLSGVSDGGFLTESFTIPSEGIDISALASQLGTTEEGITLLLQQNNIIESSVHSNGGNSRAVEHEDGGHRGADDGSGNEQSQRPGSGDRLGQENPSADSEQTTPGEHCASQQDGARNDMVPVVTHKGTDNDSNDGKATRYTVLKYLSSC